MKKILIGLLLLSTMAFGAQKTKVLTVESSMNNASIEKMIDKEMEGLDVVSVQIMPIGTVGKMRVVIIYKTKK